MGERHIDERQNNDRNIGDRQMNDRQNNDRQIGARHMIKRHMNEHKDGKRRIHKDKRRELFLDMISKDPFQTDEEIAEALQVSVPTVRLDRSVLSIPELRERIRNLAANASGKLRSLDSSEIIGQIVELELNNIGVSILVADDSMVFEKTGIVRGHFIYALAETLAIAVINEDTALVGVANVKYSIPVYAGSRLIARCELRDVKSASSKRYLVWVKIYVKRTEVFRGKFTLVSFNSKQNPDTGDDIDAPEGRA